MQSAVAVAAAAVSAAIVIVNDPADLVTQEAGDEFNISTITGDLSCSSCSPLS